MKQTLETRTEQPGVDPEIMNKINALDLDPIKYKLIHEGVADGWNRERADRVEDQYKKFLYMSITQGNASTVPTKDIDEFWHQHILDTHKYADDCQRTFGFFLHHFPYLGLRGEEDAKLLQLLFQRTRARYESLFGGNYGNNSTDCKDCGDCGDTCGVGERSPDVRSQVRPTLALLTI